MLKEKQREHSAPNNVQMTLGNCNEHGKSYEQLKLKCYHKNLLILAVEKHMRGTCLTRLLAGLKEWPIPWKSTGACHKIIQILLRKVSL